MTGLRIFDETLDGGLTKGAITELSSGPANAGSATLIAASLQRACRERYFIALIDGRDSFDPQSVGGTMLALICSGCDAGKRRERSKPRICFCATEISRS